MVCPPDDLWHTLYINVGDYANGAATNPRLPRSGGNYNICDLLTCQPLFRVDLSSSPRFSPFTSRGGHSSTRGFHFGEKPDGSPVEYR